VLSCHVYLLSQQRCNIRCDRPVTGLQTPPHTRQVLQQTLVPTVKDPDVKIFTHQTTGSDHAVHQAILPTTEWWFAIHLHLSYRNPMHQQTVQEISMRVGTGTNALPCCSYIPSMQWWCNNSNNQRTTRAGETPWQGMGFMTMASMNHVTADTGCKQPEVL
jgi:hypothetical protein